MSIKEMYICDQCGGEIDPTSKYRSHLRLNSISLNIHKEGRYVGDFEFSGSTEGSALDFCDLHCFKYYVDERQEELAEKEMNNDCA